MSLTSNLNSDSKASLPPPTPQKQQQNNFPPHHMLPDVGKPPTSPTKSPHRLIPVLDNGKFCILNIILLEFIFLTLLVHPIAVKTKDGHPVVEDLKKQLREKDMVLTDIRLEADTDENT